VNNEWSQYGPRTVTQGHSRHEVLAIMFATVSIYNEYPMTPNAG
jgi:hypothetical protein